MTAEIHVVGYPRSGTVWLTRLMSDLLDSPIATLNNPPSEYQRKILELKPIAHALFDTLNTDFCETGTGGYQIIKVHLPAHQWMGRGKVIFIQRDPRDVAVSAAHYLNIPLWDVLRNMCIESSVPFDKTRHIYHVQGAYADFVGGWLDLVESNSIAYTKYEWLSSDTPIYEMIKIYEHLTGERIFLEALEGTFNPDKFRTAFDRQRFDRHKDKYPHSMRKGIVGDWRNHFERKHGEMITEHLGELMIQQGYIDSLDWWKGIQ